MPTSPVSRKRKQRDTAKLADDLFQQMEKSKRQTTTKTSSATPKSPASRTRRTATRKKTPTTTPTRKTVARRQKKEESSSSDEESVMESPRKRRKTVHKEEEELTPRRRTRHSMGGGATPSSTSPKKKNTTSPTSSRRKSAPVAPPKPAAAPKPTTAPVQLTSSFLDQKAKQVKKTYPKTKKKTTTTPPRPVNGGIRPSYKNLPDTTTSKTPFGSPRPTKKASPKQQEVVHEEEEEEDFTDDEDVTDSGYDSGEEIEEEHPILEPRPQQPPAVPQNGAWWWSATIAGIFGVVFVSILLGRVFSNGLTLPSLKDGMSSSSQWWTSPPVAPPVDPCFVDSPTKPDQEALAPLPHCDGVTKRLPCPKGAYCARGQIQRCADKYHEVAMAKNACILTAATNTTIAQMKDLVYDWTVQHYCSPKTRPNITTTTADKDDQPLFSFNAVTQELNTRPDHKLVALANEIQDIFVLERQGKDWWIGLHPAQVVKLPTMCGIRLLVSSLLGLIGAALSALFWGVVFSYLGSLMSAPLLTVAFSVGGFLVVAGMLALKRRYDERKLLELDISRTRQSIWDHLFETRQETTAIHLRDRIIWELYETSREGRERILKRAWPRVVNDIRQDNRIHSTYKMVGGHQREVWKWVDEQSPTARRVAFRNN